MSEVRAMLVRFRCDSPALQVAVTVPFFRANTDSPNAARAFARKLLSDDYDWTMIKHSEIALKEERL